MAQLRILLAATVASGIFQSLGPGAYAQTASEGEADAKASAVPRGPLGTSQAPKTVFILPIRLVEIENEGLGNTIASWIAEELAPRTKAYPTVVTQEDIQQQVAAEDLKKVLNCEDDEDCRARIEKLTDADLLVSGDLGRIGREFSLALSVQNSATGVPLNKVAKIGNSLQEFKDRMPQIVGELFRSPDVKVEEFVLPYKEGIQIGIFDIKPTGVEKDTVDNLAQILAAELAKVRGAQIVSPEDIAASIGAARFNEIVTGKCTDECFAKLAGALNVDYLIVGQVGKVDAPFIVSLRLIDQKNSPGRVVRRETVMFHGPVEELKRAVRTVGRQVLGIKAEGEGRLTFTGPVTGAKIEVGGSEVGEIPVQLADPFPAGQLNNLRIRKDGYLDWRSDVFVQPGEENTVWVKLKEAPKSIFEQWWFWALVGVGVAGGAVAGWQISQQTPENGGGTVTINNSGATLGR